MKPNRPTLLAVIAFVWLGGALGPPVYAASSQISWSPETVERTIGNGNGATPEALVSFTSPTELTGVDVWVTPELRPFVRVGRDHFELVPAGTPSEIRLRFVVPPHAIPGTYEGTVHLRQGNRTLPHTLKVAVTVDFGDTVIPDTTVVLSESSLSALDRVSPDGTIYEFSEAIPELDVLDVGDVVVMGVGPMTPNGALRRVSWLYATPNFLAVATTQASLTDALEKASIDYTQQLDPEDIVSSDMPFAGTATLRSAAPAAAAIDAELGTGLSAELDAILYDHDGDLDTEDDQITAFGTLSLGSSLGVSVSIDHFEIDRASFTSVTTEQASLGVRGKVDLLSINSTREVARIVFSPVTVYAGWVPVVFVPVASVDVGLDGRVTVGIVTSIVQEASFTSGVVYENDSWTTTRTFDNAIEPNPPVLTAEAAVKGYAGPRINVMLYGVIGPHVGADAYLELDADLFAQPWWQLYGGLRVGAGFEVELLGRSLASYYKPDLIDHRVLLAEAQVPPPPSPGPALYYTTQDGKEVHRLNPDGTDEFLVYAPYGSCGQIAVSPTDENVALSCGTNGWDNQVWVVPLDHAPAYKFADAQWTNFVGWIDDHEIAFDRNRTGIFRKTLGTTTEHLWIAQSAFSPFSRNSIRSPFRWSEDRTRFAVGAGIASGAGNTVFAGDLSFDSGALSSIHRISPWGSSSWHYGVSGGVEISSDGGSVYYGWRDISTGRHELRRSSFDGSGEETIWLREGMGEGGVVNIRLSRDASRLWFLHCTPSGCRLASVDPDGSDYREHPAPQTLSSFDFAPATSPPPDDAPEWTLIGESDVDVRFGICAGTKTRTITCSEATVGTELRVAPGAEVNALEGLAWGQGFDVSFDGNDARLTGQGYCGGDHISQVRATIYRCQS